MEALESGRAAAFASSWKWTRNPHVGSEGDAVLAAEWDSGYREGMREMERVNADWTRRMHERGDRVRGISQEEKNAMWARMRDVEKEARGAVPSPEPGAGVTIASPRTSSRHYSYKVIHGPRAGVLAYCAHVFATDSCTPCYEHMLWRMFGADEHEDRTLAIWLSKSNYAGD